MIAFTVRAKRLQQIERAISRTADANLESRLTSLAGLWKPEDWTTSDETVERTALQLIWSGADIAQLAFDDAVRLSMRANPIATPADDIAMGTLSRDYGPILVVFRQQVIWALGGSKARLAKLAPVVHEEWLGLDATLRPYPYDDVAMLMPLGLETVFLPPEGDAPDAGLWTMMLRVIPQPPSIDTHLEVISEGELEAATTFWRSVGSTARLTPARLEQPRTSSAFAELAGSVGPARAAWLLTATKAARRAGAIVAEPITAAAENAAEHPRVRGLPPRLTVSVWTYRDGHEVLQRIGELPDESRPPDAKIAQDIPLPLPDSVGTATRSWNVDWEEARRIGLGGVYLLPDGLGPMQLGGVCVAGIGDEPSEDLVRGHLLSGNLARVSLGAATNSVGGADSATTVQSRDGAKPLDGAPDLEDWKDTVARRLDTERVRRTRNATPKLPPTATDRVLARNLAGITAEEVLPSAAVPAELDRRDIEEAPLEDPVPSTGLSRLMLKALWPTLWGTWLLDGWPVGSAGIEFASWAAQWVSPEGPLPPVRFGRHPYGLLPVTDLESWAPGFRSSEPEQLVTGMLARSLVTALDSLHGGLREDGTVLGADEEDYAGKVGRGGSSRRFRWRAFLSDGYWESINPGQDAGPFRDDLGKSLGWLGLPYDPSWGAPIDVLTSMRSDLELVQPHRSSYVRLEGPIVRAPLRHVIDLALRRRQFMDAPGDPPQTVRELFTPPDGLFFLEEPWNTFRGEELGILPDALLSRLLAQATVTANGWRSGLAPGDRDTFLEQLWRVDPPPTTSPDPSTYEEWRDDPQMRAAIRLANLVDPGPVEEAPLEGDLTRTVRFPSVPVYVEPGVKLRAERALGAVLDTASTRIDPWVTAFAWQRLSASDGSAERRQRLGAYGWAYGPFVGDPGPTASGLLHTPSLDQTTIATILRDNHLEAARQNVRNEDGELLWQMNISSDAMRIADEIAEDVRQGLHIYDVLGRAVEAIVANDGDPAASNAYNRISSLRLDYPMHDDRPDPRQVCHGLDALFGNQADAARPGLIDDAHRQADSRHPLSAEQCRRLGLLRQALDVLSDLTLIEGATQSLTRSVGRASAAMDAASGLGKMPSLDYPRTKPSGFIVETTVLSVIPERPAVAAAGGGALAEPSVAAFLAERFGTDWEWSAQLEDGTSVHATLADLGLTPIDTLSWSPDQLRALARAAMNLRDVVIDEIPNRTWLTTAAGEPAQAVTLADLGAQATMLTERTAEETQRLVLRHRFGSVPPAGKKASAAAVESAEPRAWTVRDTLGTVLGVFDLLSLGLPETADGTAIRMQIRARVGSPATMDLEHPEQTGLTDPPELALCGRLASMLGTPATQRHLARPREVVDESPVFEEMRARYTTTYADLVAAQSDAAAAGRLGVGGAQTQRAAIRRAALWGFTPDTTAPDAAAFHAAMLDRDAPTGATSMRDLARQAAAVLRGRLEAAPQPTGARGLRTAAKMTAPLPDHAELRADGIPDGVQGLASALSALVSPQGSLPVLAAWDGGDLTDRAGLGTTPAAALDVAWLTVAAAVRPPLARLEAVQLGPDPLAAWSSSTDPWLGDEVDANVRARRSGGDITAMMVPRLFVAYGPDDAVSAPRIVAGIVDAYSEAVPMDQRDTHAAFGFNAPAARAPQAILLAVPPVPRTRINDATLERILSQTRALMVARTATVDSLARLDRVLRSTFVPYSPEFLADPAYPR